MNKRKGFTLVELLAVIVILAVILVIAIPRITDVIKNSRKSSFADSAQLIATQAEKQWLINQTLSPSDSGYVDLSADDACSKVSKYNNSDYDSCSISVDTNGNATITLIGKGKFDGFNVCNKTLANMEVTEEECGESISSTWVYAFGSIENASEGKENFEDVGKPVFIRYNRVDLTETYLCTTYNTPSDGEPLCISNNAYNEYMQAAASDKINTEWNKVKVLFGSCYENPNLGCNAYVDSVVWSCGAGNAGYNCSWDGEDSGGVCNIRYSGEIDCYTY